MNHIDEIWASDLVEMQQFSKWNKGYRYLLMVIDVFSKYGWIVPLKDKKGESVTKAFSEIFKEGRKPQYLWVDKGKEFYNKHLKDLLEKMVYICTPLKMRRNPRWLEGGIEQLNPKCGNSSLFKVIQCISIYYQKC